MVTGGKIGIKIQREIAARNAFYRVAPELGNDVAQMVANAIKAGQSPEPILQNARRARQEREERDRLLVDPPPLFGSARFASSAELSYLLKGRDAFDTPSSILLGAYEDDTGLDQTRFVHWDGAGHLLTLAPTRTGKALTTIIPNLLRYRGSAVVLDPKGELYAATSKWRAENVGPVYRIAPFDTGDNPATADYVRHGFNPMAFIESEADARELASQLFPRDPKSPEFFAEDAISFVTGVILYVLEAAPVERRNLAEVQRFLDQSHADLETTVNHMLLSDQEVVVAAANNVLGKSQDRGLPNLKDSINAKMAVWRTSQISASVSRNDLDFKFLKEQPATVYIDIPFKMLGPFSPWVRVVLKSALDAMLGLDDVPEIPVLFVLDEFASLGPFHEFRDAIRTHAGSGVRLWFFLQDMGALEESYPNGGWKAFFNCAVKQYFGTNEIFTAELISKTLGSRTQAYLSSSSGGNVSSQGGGWMQQSSGSNVGISTNESIQYTARQLMQPDEVLELLGGWTGDGLRRGIVDLSSPRPFKTFLSIYQNSATCRDRIGALTA